MGERFVWIVAGDAGDAGVAFGPAFAIFETIGGEADIKEAGFDQVAGDDVLPGAVASTAKIDVIDAG